METGFISERRTCPADVISTRRHVYLDAGHCVVEKRTEVCDKFSIISFSAEKMKTDEMMPPEPDDFPGG